MFTFKEVMEMVKKAREEEKKTKFVPHYYKKNGVMVRRSSDDIVYTDEYKKLFFDSECKTLRSDDAKIFKCACCNQMFGYWDLEAWCCTFDEENGNYICDLCYEEEMGEDL